MAGKQNYKVTALLETARFKAGANVLRREFASLKTSVVGFTSALGASLGVFNLISRMKDVAVSLNVARATLHNTSASALEYGRNLEYLDRLAKDYKQDIIILTDSFAKFHAASQGTNFSLEEQKRMYEGLVKAATFYHMSAERTEDMLVAVEQMMSKGKVTAEELRRQLGNNLPGAYAKMAKAAMDTGYAGVKSFADFEKAMKAGRIGVDLLARFIDNLQEEVEHIDLNSLQLQINELKNTFTAFVDSSDFEEFLKKAIDYADRALKYLANNFDSVLRHIELIFGTLFGIKIIGWLGKAGKAVSTFMGALGKLYARLMLATRSWSALAANIVKGAGSIGKTFAGGLWGTAIAGLTLFIDKFVGLKRSVKEAKDEIEELRKIEYTGEGSLDERAQEAFKNKKKAEEAIKEAEAYFNTKIGFPKKTPGELYGTWQKQITDPNIVGGPFGALTRSELQSKIDEYEKNVIKLTQARWQLKQAEEELLKITKEQEKQANQTATGNTLSGGDDEKETDFEKAIKKYQKGISELTNQFEAGSITAQEYRDEAQKLAQKSWENITAFNDFRGEITKLSPELQKVAADLEDAFMNPYLYNAVESLKDITKDFYSDAVKSKAMADAGYMTKSDYYEAIEKSGEKAIEAMNGINGLADVLGMLDPITQQIIANIISMYDEAVQYSKKETGDEIRKMMKGAMSVPKSSNRFAYKQTKSEQYEALAEDYEDWVETWTKISEKAAKEVSDLTKEELESISNMVKEASKDMQDYKDLADVHEWLDDIQELKKELGKGIYGGIKDTAEAMDRMTRGVKQFKETMEDSDASAWDKILESINLVIQSIDTLSSLMENLNTITEVSRNLAAAKNAEELKALYAKLAGEGALINAKGTELALDKAVGAQAVRNTAASYTETTAKSGEAVAGAVASGSKAGWPALLVAIPAAVGVVLAALKAVKGFATGGIVGGNSYHGDKVITGLNSGEIVMNQNQQNRLWSWLNGRGTAPNGSGGEVKLRVEGKDLVGVIKNYETIRKG